MYTQHDKKQLLNVCFTVCISYSIAFCSILPQDLLDFFFFLQLCLFSQSGPECYLKTDFDISTSFKEKIISIPKYWCMANSILTNMKSFILLVDLKQSTQLC